MNFRLFGCGKFKWLAIERFDRQFTPKEDAFYRKHREVCFTCMRYEQQGTNSMNLLNAAALEPEISEDFDEKVLRVLRQPRKRFSLASVTPVLAGAAVAGLALLATFEIMSQPSVKIWGTNTHQGADHRFYNQEDTLPSLVLPEITR